MSALEFPGPNWIMESLLNSSVIVGSIKASLGEFWESNPTTSVFLFMFIVYYLYYVKNVVRKPELICSNQCFRKFLETNCPAINQEFKPTIWCPHTHAQTLLANGIRAVIPIPQYRREFVFVDDLVSTRNKSSLVNENNTKPQQFTTTFSGQKKAMDQKCNNRNSYVTIDWYEGPGPTGLKLPDVQKFYAELLEKYDESNYVHSTAISPDDGKPIAIFLPGLAGDSQTEYIRTAVTMINSIGYKTCVFNNRARGGIKLKTPRLYCATNYDDVEACFKHIKLTHPNSRIVAVGISLGGIVLTRYLADKGDDALVDAAMLVSVCFDVKAGCDSLEQLGLNSALNTHLTKSLVRLLEENKEILEAGNQPYNLKYALESKNLRQFDERFTAPMWGYSSVDEYHEDASNKNRIHLIKKPTLCINAADDIFCPYPYLPLQEISSNDNCAMLITARGGHIGFMEGLLPYVPTFYLERVIAQYLGALKDVESLNSMFNDESIQSKISHAC